MPAFDDVVDLPVSSFSAERGEGIGHHVLEALEVDVRAEDAICARPAVVGGLIDASSLAGGELQSSQIRHRHMRHRFRTAWASMGCATESSGPAVEIAISGVGGEGVSVKFENAD